jgi:hypothetical protein
LALKERLKEKDMSTQKYIKLEKNSPKLRYASFSSRIGNKEMKGKRDEKYT